MEFEESRFVPPKKEWGLITLLPITHDSNWGLIISRVEVTTSEKSLFYDSSRLIKKGPITCVEGSND